LFVSVCEGFEGRELLDPPFEVRNDGCDLCLLEHELRDEDLVRIACFSPRQGAGAAREPIRELRCEAVVVREFLGIAVGLRHGWERSGICFLGET
jgi:hypothetical protein